MFKPYRKLYAVIAGRSSRREFWMFTLLNVIIFAGLLLLVTVTFGTAMLRPNPGNLEAMALGAGFIGMLALAIPMYIWAMLTAVAGTAVTIRRLHDLNMSGWFYVLYLLLLCVPLLNLLAIVGMIVLMCIKGTDGPNRHGPDPTRPAELDVFA